MLVPCCCAPARPPTQQRAGLRCGRGSLRLVGGRTDSGHQQRQHTGNWSWKQTFHNKGEGPQAKTSIFVKVRLQLYWQHAAGSRSHAQAESRRRRDIYDITLSSCFLLQLLLLLLFLVPGDFIRRGGPRPSSPVPRPGQQWAIAGPGTPQSQTMCSYHWTWQFLHSL